MLASAMNDEEFQAQLRDFKAMSSAFFAPAIVLSALELGVFEALREATSADDLGERLALHPASLKSLLRSLVALGYLTKRGDLFENGAFAARALVPGQPAYEGDSALMSLWFLRLAGGLSNVIRTGAPEETMEEAIGHSDSRARIVVRAMDQVARGFTAGLDANLDLRGVETVLDIGGAAGTMAHALLERCPGARATVFELPNAAAEARRLVRERGWDQRVTIIEGDFRHDALGGPYDIVLVSNVFHLLEREACAALIRKAASCLNPGGRLVIKEMLGGEDGELPRGLASYAVLMLLISRCGALYDAKTYGDWCVEAGLEVPERIDCWERSSLLISRRPR